eukprot:gene1420-2722_t
MASESGVWGSMLEDSSNIIIQEPLMISIIQENILNHASFKDALIHRLLTTFITPAHSSLLLKDGLKDLYNGPVPGFEDDLESLAVADLIAVYDRDPACDSYVTAFLYFKGYKAIQCHRAAHALFNRGNRYLALYLQSKCCELYGLDIHPAAFIGRGLFIDHGTGVVIGETAVIGQNCSLLHGVTLGSTGKSKCRNRHPKIGNDVLIGCGASILGNISVGDNCKIGAGSIVLKHLPAGSTAVGNPARVIGMTKDLHSGSSMDLGLMNVTCGSGAFYIDDYVI